MGILDLLWAYLLVFVFAAIPFFEAAGVITIAIVAGLPPVPVIIIGLIGNILTVILLILFINKIKEWRRKRKGNDEEEQPTKRTVRAKNLWKKYGLPGLAIIGPLFIGSHLTAFMSITLGGTKIKTSIWVTVSIVLWGVIFGVLAYLGVDLLGYGDRGLFKDIISND